MLPLLLVFSAVACAALLLAPALPCSNPRTLTLTLPPAAPALPPRHPPTCQVALSALSAVSRLLPTLPDAAADSSACNVLVPALCAALASAQQPIRAAAEGALLGLHAVADPAALWPLMASSAQYGAARAGPPIVDLFARIVGTPALPDRPQLLLKHVLPVRMPGRKPRTQRPHRNAAEARARRTALPPSPSSASALAPRRPRAAPPRSLPCGCSTRRARR